MKPNTLAAVVVLCSGLFFLSGAFASASEPSSAPAQPRLNIDLQHPGPKISPTFYGMMTEEINHSYDGGLYAELIQNRIFRDNKDEPIHWSVVKTGGANAEIQLDSSDPINTTALTKSLKLTFNAIGANANAGVANDGFWGIPVYPNTQYRCSFYAKATDLVGLTASIENADGSIVYAKAPIPLIGAKWTRYEATLTTGQVDRTADARFVISTNGKATLWLNLVSLFPPTFNNRPNGNRIDLMQLLGDMHPTFLRLPGGNYLEGNAFDEYFAWKKTIGDLEDRPGHQGPWGYRSSDGMGLLEFMDWCEDLKVQPVLAVFAGYVLTHHHKEAGADLQPYVDEALDEIEYCTGNASTKWGQERAKDGHPEPFKIQYVEIGNEDWFDGPKGNYDARFAQFYDAIKGKYPTLQLIATTPVKSRTPDVIDDHYYRSSRAMERDVHHYDKTDRNGPKIFVGEWATTEGRPTPNFRAALADAAWLTGLERNSDIVVMNCYAPLLVNVQRGGSQWGTNLIGYNAINSFGSTSYYAQKMFGQNVGDIVLPVDVSDVSQDKSSVAVAAPVGGIGVGTWNTQAEYKDLKVSHGDQTLFQSDFSNGTTGWCARNGKWGTDHGVLMQTGEGENCRITAGDPKWTDYTYSLKARKTNGSEGFLVIFHARGRNDYMWWNLGGWGNSQSQLEKTSDGEKSPLGNSAPVTIETNRWYDIRIEVAGTDIKCYLDDKLITETTDTPPAPLTAIYTTASRVDATGEVILKVVNISSSPVNFQINLQGAGDVSKDARLIQLMGKPEDQNTIDEPEKVVPQEMEIHDAGSSFAHEFPDYSVSVLKFATK